MSAPVPAIDGVYTPFPDFASWSEFHPDTTAFDRYAELLSDSRARATPEALQAALDTATRYAAVDTGAIEGLYSVDRGFTRTVATQAAAWEAMVESRGPHVRLAIDDALRAYEFVLDAATQSREVSEMWIRQLHEIVCASQDTYVVYTQFGPEERPLIKGKYKTMPNSPTLSDGRIHAYAPVLDTPPEMERLVRELRSEAFLMAHPVMQAAYAHYAYVCIHPFADGNGRVARALASVYLYRNPGVPMIVFADQREDYLDALEAADGGDPTDFIQFIGTRTVDAIGIVRSLLGRSSPSARETLAQLSQHFTPSDDAAERLAIVSRLRGLVFDEFSRQLKLLPVPPQLRLRATRGMVSLPDLVPGFQKTGDSGAMYLAANSSWPTRVSALSGVDVQMKDLQALDSEGRPDFVVAARSGEPLEVWLREIDPSVQETLKIKVSGWVESRVDDFLQLVQRRIERERSHSGA